MVNYENAKVYKIWSTQGDKIYVGSTTKDYLSQRMDTHRSDYKLWKQGKRGLVMSFTLFDEYGLENCFIELLDAKTCTSKDELKKLEGGYIRNLTCVNKYIPDRDKKEYYEDNKEQILEQKKEYYNDNKEKINEIVQCQCGCFLTRQSKSSARHINSQRHINGLKTFIQKIV